MEKITFCDENEFLCGETMPDRFAECAFEDYAHEIHADWDPEDMIVFPGREEYALGDNGYNVFLLHRVVEEPWKMVGFYAGPTVCIATEHQGKGFGAELILHAARIRGGPPTMDCDKQMFSKAGLAAHRSAYRLGLARGWFEEVEKPRPNPYVAISPVMEM
jgi:GNAT superfamily N-acetyltransferase